MRDIKVRKTLIHAVNKLDIINKELKGLQGPVDNIFPRTAPFCDVELTPKWAFDLEKSKLLNCNDKCGAHKVEFILNQGDATHAAIEDDIRGYVEKVGFQVTTTRLSKDDWNAAQVAGNFSISFSETWGAPYDPHSYASAWLTGNEGRDEQ